MNQNFENEINELIIKYKLDKDDPLFAFLEIQMKILNEMKNINQNNTNLDSIQKLKDEIYFSLKEQLGQGERDIDLFLSNIKSKTKKELEEFNNDIQLNIIEDKKVEKCNYSLPFLLSLFVIGLLNFILYSFSKLF